jgi:hypothetical protein
MSKTLRSAAVLAIAIGGFALPSWGQVQETEKSEKRARKEKEEILPLLQYTGGPVGKYVELIRGYTKANILIGDEVAKLDMPAVELRDVELRTALEVVPQLVSLGDDARMRLQVLDGASPVFVFKVDRRPENPPSLEVFSLQGLLSAKGEAKLKQETILTAIEKDLAEMPQNQASVSFHPESGLLLVKGWADQLKVVKQVIEKLEEGVGRIEQAGETVKMREAEDAIRKVEAEKEQVLVRLQAMESQMQILQRQNEELRMTIDRMKAERQPAEKGGSPEKP